MSYRVVLQPGSSTTRPERYTPEALRHIGSQIEALLSRHSSLEMYRRSIECQLGLIAAHVHEAYVSLIPGNVFLLLELRGSGGVGAHLDQIVRVLREVGYWKPPVRVQDYHRQDVYYLGRSAQKLFDDYARLDRRVRQLYARLEHIKEYGRMKPETAPREVIEGLATASDGATLSGELDAIVDLLRQSNHTGRFE